MHGATQPLILVAIAFGSVLCYPVEETSTSSRKVARIAPGFSEDPNSRRANLGESENEGLELVQALAKLPEPRYEYTYPPNPVGTEQEHIIQRESPLSQFDSKYGKVQQFVADIVQPKPIVDTISEKDKYGNSGDQFRSIATVFVNGFEGFSNLLNTALELPGQVTKKATKKVSEYLNGLTRMTIGL